MPSYRLFSRKKKKSVLPKALPVTMKVEKRKSKTTLKKIYNRGITGNLGAVTKWIASNPLKAGVAFAVTFMSIDLSLIHI